MKWRSPNPLDTYFCFKFNCADEQNKTNDDRERNAINVAFRSQLVRREAIVQSFSVFSWKGLPGIRIKANLFYNIFNLFCLLIYTIYCVMIHIN